MSERAHSYLGASNMHRWSACPGSFELNKTAPSGKPGRAALAGTLSHKLGEEMVKSLPVALPVEDISAWMDAWLAPVTNRVYAMHGADITFTPEMTQSVKQWGTHAVERIRASSWHGLELRLDLGRWFDQTCPPPVPLFGRADLVAYSAITRVLDVSDYKTGGSYVSEVENLQAFYYAAGAYYQAPGPVDTIRVNIVQPAFADRVVRSFEVPTINLLIWVDRVLKPAIQRVNDPMAPLTPGDHCKWCPSAATCPALTEFATKQAAAAFEPIVITDDELGKALDDARVIELWIDAIRELAVTRINAGEHIPGWGMLPGRKRREWIAGAEGAVTHVFTAYGLDPADIYQPTELRSPAQMEKLLKSHPPDVWKEVTQHVQLKPTEPRLGQVKNRGEEFPEIKQLPEGKAHGLEPTTVGDLIYAQHNAGFKP